MDTKILKKAGYVLRHNPLFFVKRVAFELKAKFLPAQEVTSMIVNNVQFPLNFALSNKVRKMREGTFQPIIGEILKRYLKPGGTFIDVGANIGYFSFIGAGLIGRKGQVHSFEPVPDYFAPLKKFADANRRHKIFVNQMAIGDKQESLTIFLKGGQNIGNNTFLPELLGSEPTKSVQVPVMRLDEYIQKKNLRNIQLIKIDVEGFEFFALKGLSNYFAQCATTSTYPAIVCEIVPDAYAKLGFQVEDVFEYMKSFGYLPYEVLNPKKPLNIDRAKANFVEDVLFLHG